MENLQLLKDFLNSNEFTESQRIMSGNKLGEIGICEEDMSNEMVRCLAKLGWVTWFDAEGSFFINNKHAEIIEYLLSGIGMEAQVSDFWMDEESLKLNIIYENSEYCYQTNVDYQSDYFEMEFVYDSLTHFFKNIKKKYKILSYDTKDQMLCILIVPEVVADFIKNHSILPLRKI